MSEIDIKEILDKSNKVIAALNSIYFCNYFISIKKGIYVISKRALSRSEGIPSRGDYEEIYGKYLERIVHPQDQKKMSEFLDLRTLPQRIKEEEHMECEFLGNQRGWCRARFIPVEYDKEGKAISVLLVSTSVDQSKQKEKEDQKKHYAFRRMTERMFHIYFTFFGVIDLVDETLRVIDANTSYARFDKNKYYDYRQIIQRELAKYIPLKEREKFVKCSSLDYIKQKLSTQEKYEFTINQYKNNNDTGSYVYHLTYLDDAREKVLCIVEEISNRVDLDEITKEISFRAFLRKTERSLRESDTEYSIIHFDIQGFKAINDQIGFNSANYILCEVTQILKNSKLDPIFVSRSMADHYYCLIERKRLDYEEINRLCEIQVNYGKSQIKVTMICGIYHVDDRNIDIRSMCDKARLAGDRLKHSDLSKHYFVFTEEMKATYLKRKNILSMLDDAIEAAEFKAYYQPIYDAHTEKIASAEALVRWMTKDGTVVSPGLFIPILEESGQISRIDIIMQKQVQQLLEKRKTMGSKIVPVSMNLSRNDLYNEVMMNHLIDNVNQMDVDSSYLKFEITESAYAEIPELGEKMIEKLKQGGSEILIDDFGSGYSSLGTLADRHFHVVKLDRMFVQRIGKNKRAEAIIASAIEMAHLLDAKVVAEGVETKEQLLFLRKKDCDYIQGFYFSKPLPAKEFEKLLDGGSSV